MVLRRYRANEHSLFGGVEWAAGSARDGYEFLLRRGAHRNVRAVLYTACPAIQMGNRLSGRVDLYCRRSHGCTARALGSTLRWSL